MRTMRKRTSLLLFALVLLLGAVRTAGADPTVDNLLDRATALLRQAQGHYLGGDRATGGEIARRALLLLDRAESLAPQSAGVAFLAAQASVFADDREGATRWIARYEERTPLGERDPNLHYVKGMAWFFLWDSPHLTIRALERMQALAPRANPRERDVLYYSALLAEGMRRARAQDYLVAIRLFEGAVLVARRLGQQGKERTARGNIGITLFMSSTFVEAAPIFDALRREDPENALWHYYYALSLAQQTKFEEAIAPYKRTLVLLEEGYANPEHLDSIRLAYVRLANCYRNLAGGELDVARRRRLLEEAMSALRRYLDIVPDSAPAHYWVGVILYEEYDRPYEALEHLKRAYALDPVCDGSLRLMVQIARNHGPPPPPEGASAEQVEEAEKAWWTAWEEWGKDLEAHAEERAAERERREQRSDARWDGCL